MRVGIIIMMMAFTWVCCRGLFICGNYCGPDWCNAQVLPESACDTSVEPDPQVYHADTCCRSHDACCGHGDRHTCNDALIACITATVGPPTGMAENPISMFICGNSSYVVGDFFKMLGIFAHVFLNKHMCCADTC